MIFYGLTAIFLHIFFKKGKQSEEDFEFRVFNLNDFYRNLKIFLCSLLEVNFAFFKWPYSHRCFDVAQRCVNRG